MTDREKLIELVADVPVNYELCMRIMGQCPTIETPCYECLADYLLANGVTFVTDTNVGSKWISVEDRLPETDGKNTFAYNVLVYIPKRDGCNQHGVYIGKLRSVKADDGSGNFWGFKTQACDWTVWGFSYFEHPVVTHWMPMPQPPKEG